MTDAPAPPESSPVPAFRWYDPRRASIRLALSTVVGVIVGAITPAHSLALRFVAGWDAGAMTLLSLAWLIIWQSGVEQTRFRAASTDPGRTLVWALVLGSSLFSLFAATVALRPARQMSGPGEWVLVSSCLLAVISAWSLTHTSFTLRYAHLYYRDDDEGIGGLEFAGSNHPDYFDFAYFAFTVGMCFQVSDVSISSRVLRRTTLVHALLSFVYNTAIVALALNLISGVVGG